MDSTVSQDADLKQFDQLFSQLVADSTSDSDPKIADAMKWFKQASVHCEIAWNLLFSSFLYCYKIKRLESTYVCTAGPFNGECRR